MRNIPTVKVDAAGHDGGVDTDVEVDMELVKQTLRQVEGVGPVGTLIPGVLGGVLLKNALDYAADTSRVNSQAQWDDVAARIESYWLSRLRASNNNSSKIKQTNEADADLQTSSGGARQVAAGMHKSPIRTDSKKRKTSSIR